VCAPSPTVRACKVLWNLLSNAIKFTPAGGQVTVDLASTDAEAVIHVTDNGRGIAGSLLALVFDRFKQGEGEGARSRTGLGLGLAIVREMVHAHRGTVIAESPGEGLGSTFTVHLPLLLPRATVLPAMLPARQSRPDLHQTRPNVLIVDDERDAREMLALVLETRGANVQHVGTAAAAFNSMIERHPPLAAGFDWHIAKPVDADELVRVVAALLARGRQ
jgi:CheY-like chemotaxis protein